MSWFLLLPLSFYTCVSEGEMFPSGAQCIRMICLLGGASNSSASLINSWATAWSLSEAKQRWNSEALTAADRKKIPHLCSLLIISDFDEDKKWVSVRDKDAEGAKCEMEADDWLGRPLEGRAGGRRGGWMSRSRWQGLQHWGLRSMLQIWAVVQQLDLLVQLDSSASAASQQVSLHSAAALQHHWLQHWCAAAGVIPVCDSAATGWKTVTNCL